MWGLNTWATSSENLGGGLGERGEECRQCERGQQHWQMKSASCSIASVLDFLAIIPPDSKIGSASFHRNAVRRVPRGRSDAAGSDPRSSWRFIPGLGRSAGQGRGIELVDAGGNGRAAPAASHALAMGRGMGVHGDDRLWPATANGTARDLFAADLHGSTAADEHDREMISLRTIAALPTAKMRGVTLGRHGKTVLATGPTIFIVTLCRGLRFRFTVDEAG